MDNGWLGWTSNNLKLNQFVKILMIIQRKNVRLVFWIWWCVVSSWHCKHLMSTFNHRMLNNACAQITATQWMLNIPIISFSAIILSVHFIPRRRLFGWMDFFPYETIKLSDRISHSNRKRSECNTANDCVASAMNNTTTRMRRSD